jgi:hypothetical protein
MICPSGELKQIESGADLLNKGSIGNFGRVVEVTSIRVCDSARTRCRSKSYILFPRNIPNQSCFAFVMLSSHRQPTSANRCEKSGKLLRRHGCGADLTSFFAYAIVGNTSLESVVRVKRALPHTLRTLQCWLYVGRLVLLLVPAKSWALAQSCHCKIRTSALDDSRYN